jgi:hypothetical protein
MFGSLDHFTASAKGIREIDLHFSKYNNHQYNLKCANCVSAIQYMKSVGISRIYQKDAWQEVTRGTIL